MYWKFFARVIEKRAGTNKWSLGGSIYGWLANRWLTKNRNTAYRIILDKYKSHGRPYKYGEDRDRDSAHFALKYVLDEELQEPEGWDAAEVFAAARSIYDSHLLRDYANSSLKNKKYPPLVIPLLVEIINDPKDGRPDVWAGIIRQCGPDARAALPALKRLLTAATLARFNDPECVKGYTDAIAALGGKLDAAELEAIREKKRAAALGGGGAEKCPQCAKGRLWSIGRTLGRAEASGRRVVVMDDSLANEMMAPRSRPSDYAGDCPNCRNFFCENHADGTRCAICNTPLINTG